MKGKSTVEELIAKAFIRINRLTERLELIKARRICERLYRQFPDHPRVLQGVGVLRFRTGKREEGERLIRRTIELRPDYADAYHNLGNMLSSSKRECEAEAMYRRAIELDPGHLKALSALAQVLNKQQRNIEALQYCEEALRINPRHAMAYEVKGSVMANIGKPDDAISFLRKAIKLKKGYAAHSSLVFNLNTSPKVEQREIYEESLLWGRHYVAQLTRRARNHLNSPSPSRRLRIGYVSGDFKLHPVAFHLRPVLYSHDKSNVEVFLYNNFPLADEMTNELISQADHYHDISALPDEDVETMIRCDSIDILVDLSGHTLYERLHLFARRPAPVQVSWLGYFNTTGVEAIDYLLSDPITIPPGEDRFFTEKVIRLPDCRFCYSPPDYAPEVATLPLLRQGFVTFCSFNKVAKANDDVIDLWSRVLHAVPGSRLMLKWSSLKEPGLVDDLKKRFSSYGIGEDRLILRESTPHPQMLAEYGDVDVALDTFPYNGGATTCEALWMGVPVVTLEGRTPIGRQSMSFLHALGYRNWVAKDKDEYLEIAKRLLSDKAGLASIRSSLRQKMAESPLCDGKMFAANLEKVYQGMWEKWCRETEGADLSSGKLRRFSTDELYGAGYVCMMDKEYPRASQLFDYVLKRKPNHGKARNNLGISLFMIGKNRESIQAFRRAIRHDKGFADAYSNLGRALLEIGEKSKALKSCKQAVAIKPDHVDGLLNLHNASRALGMIGEARRALEQVLEIDQNNSEAVRSLSVLFQEYGDSTNAIKLLEDLLAREPENLTVISTLLWVLQLYNDATQEVIFKHSRRYGELLGFRCPALTVESNTILDKGHLKIGFVSADFRYHPVGELLAAFFREYDPARLSLYCYNNGRKQDELTDFYRATANGWREIFGMSDSEAASLVRRDGIDILIDLSGHTDGARLQLFSMRPAPIQATWMGYWNTTGLLTIDYIIADEDMIRPEDEKWFTERVVRLPYSRFCFTPPPNSPDVVDPPFEDNGYITFGSFNNVAKISTRVIGCWAEILRLVPRSRLILKWRSLKDPGLRDQIRDMFQAHGVQRNRVEFRTESTMYFMMLEYGDVDIALDPFPYTGGITSLNALWMGVPVITLSGELPISRQTRSFLRLIGLPDLVAEREEDYIAMAAELAADTDRLRNIRASMRDKMLNSPLCDGKGFAESVQEIVFSMWRTAQEQKGETSIFYG